MADPLTLLGLAASILQVFDVSARLISKSRELYGSTTGTFKENYELEFLVTDFHKSNAKLARIPLQISSEGVIDPDDKALRELVCRCNEVSHELLGRLELLKCAGSGDARALAKTVQIAWKYMRSESQLRALAARVSAFREELQTRIMASLMVRFDGLALEQQCRFDSLDRTGQQIMDSIKQNQIHITSETNNQTEYLTLLLNVQHREVMGAFSSIARSRPGSPNPFADGDEGLAAVPVLTVHTMIENDDFEGMKKALLLNPEAAFQRGSNGETPLHIAARKGNVDALSYLIRKGANKNADDNSDRTPLHVAATGNYPEIVRELLVNGANPKLRDENGNTPSEVATPRSEVAWIFSVGTGLEDHDDRGFTVLTEFVDQGDQATVLRLLEASRFSKTGADIHAPWHNGSYLNSGLPLQQAGLNEDLAMMQLLIDKGANVDELVSQGGSLLHRLSGGNKIAAMKLLLDHGADINAQNVHGCTALLESARFGYEESCAMLLSRGANTEVALCESEENVTPLLLAARTGKHGIIKQLLDHGANIEAKTTFGWTALHEAAEHGHEESCVLLLSRGMHVDSRSTEGHTPLFLAAGRGFLKSVKSLVEHGADVNKRCDDIRLTPLLQAALYGHDEVFSFLLDHGGDIHTTDINGGSILWHVVGRSGPGFLNITRTLLDRGARMDSCSAARTCVYHNALGYGPREIVEFLSQRGGDSSCSLGDGAMG